MIRLGPLAVAAVLMLGLAAPVRAQTPPAAHATEPDRPARPPGQPADDNRAAERLQDRTQNRASDPGARRGQEQARGPERSNTIEGRQLPPDVTTRHTVQYPDRILRFEAVAGSVPLTDRQGKLEAEIGVVAYLQPDADPLSRPVTFVINGGPGASSAFLQLGAIGPWLLPLDGPTISPSAPPVLVPNPETWLDFTDLVFIDPVGTGYSRLAGTGDELRQRYLSVEGDVEALSNVIARWLKTNGRMVSPKFYAGESYGGFRGPLIADKLQTDQGVGLSGLVLLSPVLDFSWMSQPGYAVLPRVGLLPSLAAAHLERIGQFDPGAVREVERYATGDYVTDLLRGVQDREAVDRVSRRVAEYTGLDPDLVRRLAGRIDMRTYQREAERGEGRIASAYDTAVTSFDPDPTAAVSRFNDPVLEAMRAPLASAAVDLFSRRLDYKVERPYELLNGAVSQNWRWGRGRSQPEAVTELRNILSLDPKVRVMIAHGYTDLVTPYFQNDLILRQIRDFGPGGRLSLQVYRGGHMFYTREDSRVAFRRDASALYRAALDAREAPPARPD